MQPRDSTVSPHHQDEAGDSPKEETQEVPQG